MIQLANDDNKNNSKIINDENNENNEKIKNEKINFESKSKKTDFKSLLNTVNTSINEDLKKNISKATCFVCLLHLINENGKKVYFYFL